LGECEENDRFFGGKESPLSSYRGMYQFEGIVIAGNRLYRGGQVKQKLSKDM